MKTYTVSSSEQVRITLSFPPPGRLARMRWRLARSIRWLADRIWSDDDA